MAHSNLGIIYISVPTTTEGDNQAVQVDNQAVQGDTI